MKTPGRSYSLCSKGDYPGAGAKGGGQKQRDGVDGTINHLCMQVQDIEAARQPWRRRVSYLKPKYSWTPTCTKTEKRARGSAGRTREAADRADFVDRGAQRAALPKSRFLFCQIGERLNAGINHSLTKALTERNQAEKAKSL